MYLTSLSSYTDGHIQVGTVTFSTLLSDPESNSPNDHSITEEKIYTCVSFPYDPKVSPFYLKFPEYLP